MRSGFRPIPSAKRSNLQGAGGALTFTLWLVCLIATSSLLKHLPVATLSQASFQEAALALVSCAALAFAWHQGGGLPAHNNAPLEKTADGKRTFAAFQPIVLGVAVVAIGALTCAFGCSGTASLAAATNLDAQTATMRGAFIATTCLLTALAEEALCRGLCFPGVIWLAERSSSSKRIPPVLLAALVSSLFFALPHVSLSVLGGSLGPFACLAGWVKLVQSASFGLIMAYLYWQTRSFASIVATHALFNLVYLGPGALASGAFATSYLVESASELAVLVLSAVALAACAVWAARHLRHSCY